MQSIVTWRVLTSEFASVLKHLSNLQYSFALKSHFPCEERRSILRSLNLCRGRFLTSLSLSHALFLRNFLVSSGFRQTCATYESGKMTSNSLVELFNQFTEGLWFDLGRNRLCRALSRLRRSRSLAVDLWQISGIPQSVFHILNTVNLLRYLDTL